MNPPWQFTDALAATTVVAGALLATNPAQPGQPPRASPGEGIALHCELAAAPGGGSQVRLSNPDGPALAAQQRLAWASLGTPEPVGEWRRLPVALAPGEVLVLYSHQPPRGSGCTAVAHVC